LSLIGYLLKSVNLPFVYYYNSFSLISHGKKTFNYPNSLKLFL